MYKFTKRLLDIILAGLALVILSPLLIIIVLILLFTGEHEVFYLQKRVGYQNKIFYIWKFATMVKNSRIWVQVAPQSLNGKEHGNGYSMALCTTRLDHEISFDKQ